MTVLQALLVVLHIIVAVAWFGLAVSVQMLSRLAHGPNAQEVGDRAMRGMTLMALLLPLVGLAAMLASGGAVIRNPIYHTSVTLALALALIQFVGVQRAWRGLPESGRAGQLNMWIGIGHLIWFVILILMLWPQYLGPAFG